MLKKIEQNHYNFWAIVEDERFPPIINKHNALIVLVKPSPRTQQVNMSRAISSYRSVHTQSVLPDVVFSAQVIENVLPLECVLNRVPTDAWWCILSEFCSCTSFDLLRISWGMFQDKVPDAEKEVTFNNVYTGKTVLTLEGVFLVQWENKGYGTSWHESSTLESIRTASRTRRLRNTVGWGP